MIWDLRSSIMKTGICDLLLCDIIMLVDMQQKWYDKIYFTVVLNSCFVICIENE